MLVVPTLVHSFVVIVLRTKELMDGWRVPLVDTPALVVQGTGARARAFVSGLFQGTKQVHMAGLTQKPRRVWLDGLL